MPHSLLKAAHTFTQSADNVNRLSSDIEAGNLPINHFVASTDETPFGAVDDSGYGREGGVEIETARNFRQLRGVIGSAFFKDATRALMAMAAIAILGVLFHLIYRTDWRARKDSNL